MGRYAIQALVIERIYTPPALSVEKAAVYGRLITVVQTHAEFESFFLNGWGTLRLNGKPFDVRPADDLKSLEQDMHLSAGEVAELAAISESFRRVGCARAEKDASHVVFWPLPTYVLSASPGVLYALDGRNPNESIDPLLIGKKPFMLIAGHWYTSKWLVLCPFPLTGSEKWVLPESLIDHSLHDPGMVAAREKREP
jgi:hypothetical protein